MMGKIFRWFIIVLVASMAVWWLNIPFLESQKNNAPTIVTSTPILQDLVQGIMGPDVNVISITKRVVDPAKQTISSKQLNHLKSADAYIYNGAKSDQLTTDIKNALGKKTTVISINEMMRKVNSDWPTYYWMSPMFYNTVIYYLQIKLKMTFPKRRSEINYRKMAYTNNILSLNQTVNTTFELHGKKSIILSNHPSFGPFAKAYGFEFIWFDLSSPLSQAVLNEYVDSLKKQNIKVLYPNDAIDQAGVDQLVKAAMAQGWQLRIGKPVISLNFDVIGSGVSNYIEMIEFNVRTLTDS